MAEFLEELDGGRFVAHAVQESPRSEPAPGWPAAARLAAVRIVPFGQQAGQPGYALLVSRGNAVRVNGLALVGGIRVLDHKDEVMVGNQRFFFSSQSTPEVVVFRREEGARQARCPVCRNPILDRQDVVFCPGCKRCFHQLAARGERPGKPCWTYAPSCKFCNHPTALSADAAWRPETEEQE